MSSSLDATSNPSSAQTSGFDRSPSLKRKRSTGHRLPFLNQRVWYPRADGCSDEADSAQVSEALAQCYDEDNAVFSCYPTANTSVAQHQWVEFVWNSRLPQFDSTNLVDIFLYNADSQELIQSWPNEVNPSAYSGQVGACVNDSFWGNNQGSNWDGENITSHYYFAITPNTQSGVAYQSPISTFVAVQTTYADWVVSSMLSASAASASSAAAASSRASATSTASVTGVSGGSGSGASSRSGSGASATATGASPSVQSLNSSKFPGWAIAVIVVLGFLALVAAGIIAFLVSRRMKQRRNSMLSHRGSMNSASPMMANAATGNAQSPLLGSAALAGGAIGAAEAGENRPTSPTEGHDGASTMSRTSADPGLFSGADAAILAAAFRSQLRKPDFTERPVEEGESPGSQATERPEAVLGRELAEEGRDIRSVGSSRGVRVETLGDTTDDDAATAATTIHDDDEAGTVQDHR
ncbi:hypothetical protein DAEQUDRAFT_363839 [Daedalea quercina L-15889]|uniref:Uncharacterized protein n=1 Tax=Daedalea quercina L-15889 TaxID=1314783 RepID=A0A165TUC9_9APHY|nr:hypothetical protein DAEQUDRAFT_363839 [Daedalea quercina L-15889]